MSDIKLTLHMVCVCVCFKVCDVSTVSKMLDCQVSVTLILNPLANVHHAYATSIATSILMNG